MRWRFTILNNRTEVSTVIDEPVGWDKNVSEIRRDMNWHGVFFTNQGDSFEFYGPSMKLLKDEYEEFGVEGDMTLICEEDCDNGYFEFSRSQFDFNKYEFYGAYVKVPVESTGQVMEIRNRIDQKVNLQTEKAYDEVTDLVPYDKLGFDMEFPSKGILLQNLFYNKAAFSTPVAGVPVNNNPGAGPSSYNTEYGMIELSMDTQTAAEIGNSGTNSQPRYNCVLTNAGSLGCNSFNRFRLPFPQDTYYIAPLDIGPIVNYQEETPNYGQVSDTVDLAIDLKGSLTNNNCNLAMLRFIVMTLPKGKSGTAAADYIIHSNQLLFGNATFNTPLAIAPGQVISLNASYFNNKFILEKGDQLFAFYSFYHSVQNSVNNGAAFSMTAGADQLFTMKTLSHTGPSISKVFAVNEVISRVAEAITNDKIRAYSEYFGREDSQPYSVANDGWGSLEVVTDGLRLRRQENKIPDKPNLFALSLQDLFDGLNPIHNIGIGIEPDSLREGHDRLRVEPWTFFYTDDLIMSCTGINKITRKVYEKEIFSTFQIGYAKWEAEEYNGLDEFLTKRSYRTRLSQIKNDFAKLSKWVASGYALEITRRKGNEDSKDWRYDKDTFIVCASRTRTFAVKFDAGAHTISFPFLGDVSAVFGTGVGGTFTVTVENTALNNFTFNCSGYEKLGDGTVIFHVAAGPAITNENAPLTVFTSATFPPGSLFAELGNVVTPENIIDPKTIYNYRISPVRNALRWMNVVLQSYRKFDDEAKIIFSDGDGNYYAEGQLSDLMNALEAGIITENQTVDRTVFEDADDARPLMLPERILYEYPMNSRDYYSIKAKPHGKIFFQSDCDEGFGYIDVIQYRPEDGMASFTLKPKITD